jgi:alcohol dehydrogenase class IV
MTPLEPFAFAGLPGRVVFGDGTRASVGDEVDRLGGPPGRIGARRALRALGTPAADLDRAVAMAIENPCANPRPVDRAGLRRLPAAAWAAEAPG